MVLGGTFKFQNLGKKLDFIDIEILRHLVKLYSKEPLSPQ